MPGTNDFPKHFGLVVVGGGLAGICAAVSAAPAIQADRIAAESESLFIVQTLSKFQVESFKIGLIPERTAGSVGPVFFAPAATARHVRGKSPQPGVLR